jgi:2-oxoglutarate ferredoxin oxidoreductase subunit alpha
MADYDVINPDAEQVFVAYGGPVRTVMQVMHDRQDKNIGFLRIRTVWPFPEKALAMFKKARRFLVPEMNLGQIAREIERHVKVPVKSIPKLGGDLHSPAELVAALEEKP